MRAKARPTHIPVLIAIVLALLLYAAAVAFAAKPDETGAAAGRPATTPTPPVTTPAPVTPETGRPETGRPEDPGGQAADQRPAEPGRPEDKPSPPGQSVRQNTPAATGLPANVDPPRVGHTVVLAPASGTVTIRRPGTATFEPLADAATLPTGTVIDATAGRIELSTALPDGTVQTGTFWGGRFVVRQGAGGMTDLVLTGGSFKRCAKPARARGPVAVAAASRGGTVVRRLWGSDRNGRFRTRGAQSVATVRGTRWLTEDRCDGTLTRVTEGAVSVRDRRTGRSTLVQAGDQHLVRR